MIDVVEYIEPNTDLRKQPDLDSRLRPDRRKAKQFYSTLGWADLVFCISCGTPRGYVSLESPAIVLCDDCCFQYGGFELPEPPRINIPCSGCGSNYRSVERDMASKVVYYCDDCDRRLNRMPPPGLVKAFV